MANITRLTLVTALALALAACTTTRTKEPTTVQAVYDRIKEAGIQAGPLEIIDLPGFQTQEKGKAPRPDGTDLYIYIPVRSWNPEAFLPMLEAAGGFTIHGTRWVVNIHDRETAERIRDTLNGTLR